MRRRLCVFSCRFPLVDVLLLFILFMDPRSPGSTLFPYTTLFRSHLSGSIRGVGPARARRDVRYRARRGDADRGRHDSPLRSEEHTSELQSHSDLVCRLLLEKKTSQNATEPLNQLRHNEAVRVFVE